MGARRAPPPRLPLPLTPPERQHDGTESVDPRHARRPGRRPGGVRLRPVEGRAERQQGDRVRVLRRVRRAPRRHRRPTRSSRSLQDSAGLGTGAMLYGVAMGGVFALVFSVAYGRIGLRTARGTAALLGLLGFVGVYVVPLLKYPAEPSVGGSDRTRSARRTALYLVMLLLSVTAIVLAVMVRRQDRPSLRRVELDAARRRGVHRGDDGLLPGAPRDQRGAAGGGARRRRRGDRRRRDVPADGALELPDRIAGHPAGDVDRRGPRVRRGGAAAARTRSAPPRAHAGAWPRRRTEHRRTRGRRRRDQPLRRGVPRLLLRHGGEAPRCRPRRAAGGAAGGAPDRGALAPLDRRLHGILRTVERGRRAQRREPALVRGRARGRGHRRPRPMDRDRRGGRPTDRPRGRESSTPRPSRRSPPNRSRCGATTSPRWCTGRSPTRPARGASGSRGRSPSTRARTRRAGSSGRVDP